jgi:hypothetical protein
MDVDFDELDDDFVPFGASPTYDYEYGRDLFARAVAGEFGPIAEYVEPVKTPEQIRDAAKATRTAQVAAITVTTQSGNTFDGDETSQGRMARAVVALDGLPQDPAPTVNWVLADNTVIQASKYELREALMLAGAAQAAIWVIP